MNSPKRSLVSRRAALAAVFAVGLHCALAGRARADTPPETSAAPVEWSTLSADEQKALGRYGDRWSTHVGYLIPARERPNLTIMTGCHVEKLIIEKGEGGAVCKGVIFTGGGRKFSAEARRETLLAAGSIGTPQILQLSGVGPAEVLRQAGVEALADRAGVGANLQDHLQLRMIFKIQGAKTLNIMSSNWFGKMRIGLEYAFDRSSPNHF